MREARLMRSCAARAAAPQRHPPRSRLQEPRLAALGAALTAVKNQQRRQQHHSPESGRHPRPAAGIFAPRHGGHRTELSTSCSFFFKKSYLKFILVETLPKSDGGNLTIRFGLLQLSFLPRCKSSKKKAKEEKYA